MLKYVVQLMMHGINIDCTTHEPWDVDTIVQSTLHEKIYCCTTHNAWEMKMFKCVVQPMVHGKWIFPDVLYNPWAMGWMCYCTIHVLWSSHSVVQSICHGGNILLYNPCSMGNQYVPLCCTTHEAWDRYRLYNPWAMGQMYCCTTHGSWRVDTIVQPIRHGVCVSTSPLYNPLFMRKIYYCTIHDLWEKYTVVQSMIHGICVPYVLLHNPWSTDKDQLCSCTIHHPWKFFFSICHGLHSGPNLHGSWIVQCIVQQLYGPWPMGILSNCNTHDPWEKVAEGARANW